MKAIAKMTLIDLAGYVGEHLARRDIDVVLSGGACVGYYSNGLYVSKDLDFINVRLAQLSRIAAAMAEIGFWKWRKVLAHVFAKASPRKREQTRCALSSPHFPLSS